MMKIIYKYELGIGIKRLSMPKNAQILSCQVQREIPVLWVLVDKGNPTEVRTFRVYDTGEAIIDFTDEGLTQNYIDTFQLKSGFFVGHVFELVKEATDGKLD